MKRGEKLYKLKHHKKEEQIKPISQKIEENKDDEAEDDDDDDLNIIPLNSWSRKLQVLSNAKIDSINMNNLSTIQQSHDSNFAQTSPVQIHKEDASDTSSISSLMINKRLSYVKDIDVCV